MTAFRALPLASSIVDSVAWQNFRHLRKSTHPDVAILCDLVRRNFQKSAAKMKSTKEQFTFGILSLVRFFVQIASAPQPGSGNLVAALFVKTRAQISQYVT